MEYLVWLNTHPFVSQYDVLRLDHMEDTFFAKLRITLIDGSVLHTKEYSDSTTRKYAFHWQKTDQQWLVRWDNAPHFPQLISFPNHRHDYRQATEVITESFDITLPDVLRYIQEQLTNTK
ncbi:DUF6516 family protein [Spirosoma sp. KUDC1026]|uniref:toxin-antitoxin system TumE family protein n=1 Tax=Spirosoma sp. KUDC1026 TaxID=2745947 RepID=UPI00159B8B64|nr:DUF6516 family protein [Spirosoma sp. KUDC1026]QKZ12403.1 hypothetical protein HU175_07100 [Spirosoma sp. KUDC1026]